MCMLDIQSKNLEHRTITMHRRINLSIVLLVLSCSLGRAQGDIYLDPVKAVTAFPSAVRAGTGSSPEQLIAVFSQEKIIKLYNANDLTERAALPAGNALITCVLLSKQSSLLFSAGVTGQIDRWDISKKTVVGGFKNPSGTILSMVELPEQRLLVAGIDKTLSLIDAVSGKKLSSVGPLDDDIVAIGVDSSGTKAVAATANGSVRYYTLPELNQINQSESQIRILRAAFSHDGKWIALGSAEGKIKLWDVDASMVRASFDESRKPITSLAFDLKGRWFVSAGADSSVRVYDLPHRSFIKSFTIGEGYASAMSFAGPDLFCIGTTTGILRTWTARETPRDTTPPEITVTSPGEPNKVFGTLVLIKGLVRDQNKITAIELEKGGGKLQTTDAQEKDRVQGLTTMGFTLDGKLDNLGDNTFVVRAADVSGNESRSSITIQRLSADQALEITYPPNNFEADKVSVNLQFKLWCEAASYRLTANLLEIAEKTNLQQKLIGQEFSEEIPLYMGYNQIQLTVVTRKGEKIVKSWGVSRKVYGNVSVAAPATKQAITPKERGFEPQLWAVVVGVSEYANKAIPSLRLADQDALAFADFLQKPEGGGYQRDHMRVLVNKDATLANLKEALIEFLSQAIDKDLVMIFFAGHGAPDPARPTNLFMLTYDTDPARLGTTAYPMWDIQTLLMRQLSAKRIVMFSDACHSGGISVDFASRGVNPTQSNLINQYLGDLARSKEGIAIFTASAAGEVSQEYPELGHGVFTYYLLEGMKGEADLNNDYTVTINELMQYVEDQVKRKTKGAQNPTRSQTMFDKDLTISKIAH